jgi:hypothetical protein
MVTALVSGQINCGRLTNSHARKDAARPHFPAGSDVISQQLWVVGLTTSRKLDDLVVLVSAVELNLPGHDRTHRGAARHAVDGPWKVQLRLDLP